LLDSWVPSTLGAQEAQVAPVPAVTVESGVQWGGVYREASLNGSFVIGGGCPTVGVVGFTLGGGYGLASKMYGTGASNLLQARIVLANGSLVTANAYENSELFWALRGGGPGLGIVTELTIRAHRAPEYFGWHTGRVSTANITAYAELIAAVMRWANDTEVRYGPVFGNFVALGRGGDGYSMVFDLSITGLDATTVEQMFQELPGWLAGGLDQFKIENVEYYPEERDERGFAKIYPYGDAVFPYGGDFPWYSAGNTGEINAEWIGQTSRYIPARSIKTEVGALDVGAKLANYIRMAEGYIQLEFGKAQHNVPDDVRHAFLQTSQNPVVLESSFLAIYGLPLRNFPQVPGSSTYLNWALPQWEFLLPQEWRVTCEAGATGNQSAVQLCLDFVFQDLVPDFLHRSREVTAQMEEDFPNVDAEGFPYSGTYFSESDYADPDWQRAQWGEAVYGRLLQVKQDMDPTGFFSCHHCVGDTNTSLHNRSPPSATPSIPTLSRPLLP